MQILIAVFTCVFAGVPHALSCFLSGRNSRKRMLFLASPSKHSKSNKAARVWWVHFADVHSIVYYVLLCIVYTTFEIQDYSFYMHYYERIVVHLTTFSASNCQAHHTGFAKVGQLRMNLKRCRRGALPFSSATNDDLWHCGKYVEMAISTFVWFVLATCYFLFYGSFGALTGRKNLPALSIIYFPLQHRWFDGALLQ